MTIDAILDEMMAVVAPGAADSKLVELNAKLRADLALVEQDRDRVTRLAVRNRSEALEAERAEAAALYQLEVERKKFVRVEATVKALRGTAGQQERALMDVEDQHRDDATAAAFAIARSVDSEARAKSLEEHAAQLLARAEAAEGRVEGVTGMLAKATKALEKAEVGAVVHIRLEGERILKAARRGHMSDVITIVEDIIDRDIRRLVKQVETKHPDKRR